MKIWAPRTTVAVIAEDDARRFLMVEERNADGQLVLNQPAGHLEEGESLTAAACREMLEETGFALVPSGLVGIYKWRVPRNGPTYVRYCFFGTANPDGHDGPLDSDIVSTAWLRTEEILSQRERHRSPMVARCLQDYLDGRRYALELIHELD
jgi:8-oxo-dGTP pyrophosphatase MutT (NUDIX family)